MRRRANSNPQPSKAIIVIWLLCLSCFIPFSVYSQDYRINDDWQYVPGYAFNMQKRPPWEEVDLPHTWNAQDIKDGKLDYYRGLGIYRKNLTLPVSDTLKRYFLKFEGSTLVTDVYINGYHAGQHKGGYTAFTLEITSWLKNTQQNEILVMVNNAFDSEVMPLVGDFNIYGGLHRPVHLLVRDQTCFDLLNHGASGIFISQKGVSQSLATVEVSGGVLSTTEVQQLTVKTSILDANGQIVKTADQSLDLAETTSWTQQLTIEKPHLWDGRKNPYLYRVESELQVNGKTVDQLVQPLGLRYFQIDSQKGFFLNGKYTDLRGVCYHEAKAGKGSALTPSDYNQDFQMMLDMGVNAIRTSHYPHSEYFYKTCDSLGIVVYTEIPMVGPGGYMGRGFMNNEGFKANGKKQLIELIRQNYNHPSIIFWGLYNEVKINGDDPYTYISELNALAKREDPTRLTMAATFQDNHNNDITDAIGWNRYFGWYGGHPKTIGEWADRMRARQPRRPLSISEYGAGASIHHHSDSLIAPTPAGKWHPEEWQNYYHEENWKALSERPYLWGKFIWLMFDFGAVHRTEGDTDGVNDKGLVTADRQVKKDAYFFYRANWSDLPTLHLVSKRFTDRVTPKTTPKAYTNLDRVSFYHNGKKIATVSAELGIAEAPEITLLPGVNEIKVRGKSKSTVMEDSTQWVLETK
ncbi:MAG: hypothetical protein KI790_16620 [Cyclobacteriaceae bacterium]|nr:hypothetical protein [Cyclobacteriaceae bacterium HetDA_MAG_MS6]